MRNRFDWIGKLFGQAALGRLGPTIVQLEISPETQYADLHYVPDPARAAERARLGLLGRLAATPCLIELYARAPADAEFRACLVKHLAAWQQAARASRRTRRRGRPEPLAASDRPFLWIIAAGTPASLVAELALAPAPGWPPGVYLFGGDVLRVGLIAANQLPRDRSTLLVRLMAAGALLPGAITELSALPRNAYERAVADSILLRFEDALEKAPARTYQEEELFMTVQGFFEGLREKGRVQGQRQARVDALLTVLRVRGVRVAGAERERILAEPDPKRLARWLERAAVADSLAAVLDEPRRTAAKRTVAARPRKAAPQAPSRAAGRRAGRTR